MFQKNHLYYALPAILVSTLAVIAIVFAWQEPGDVPPLDNVPAPINVGSYFQSKSGPLTVESQFIAATSTLLATNGGRVGIGTVNPGSTLTVRRSAAGNALAIRNIGNTVDTFTVSDTGFAHMTGLRLGESATAGYVLTANVDGVGTWEPSAGGIAWPLRSPIPGTATEPAYSWSADTNTGIRLGGADNLRFVTNGADRLTINSSGDVGIGATAPGAKLEVAGQIKITGGSPGDNKVLTSDGTGLASWQTPSGSGGGYEYRSGYVWCDNVGNWEAPSPGNVLDLDDGICQATYMGVGCTEGRVISGLCWCGPDNPLTRVGPGVFDSVGATWYPHSVIKQWHCECLNSYWGKYIWIMCQR